MTFLELCQEVVRTGGITGTGPTSVTGQAGEYLRIVRFVSEAYEEVCNQHFDWDFLWGQEISTVSTQTVTAPANVGIWDAGRLFLDGEALECIPHADYMPETLSNARPYAAVILPSGALQLIPAPDQPYDIVFDYFKAAPALAENTDNPLMPARFHRVIVGRALMLLGNWEDAEDIMKQGQELYQQYLATLEAHQLSRRQQTHGRQEARDITVFPQ